MAVIVPIVSEWNPKGVDRAMADIKKAEGKLGKMKAGLGKAFLPATAALAGLGAVAWDASKAAEELASSQAALGQVFDQMGVGEATGRVTALADELERTLGIDEKLIMQVQTTLGTFGELAASADTANGAFDRTTMAALDLAAAGFGSAEGNAVQLGKALNDPVKGLAALSKSGVTFTDQQKDQIKALVESNKMLEAQELVLEAIEGQVGGTSLATADSSAKMSLAFADLKETLGTALLPVFNLMNDKLAAFAGFASQNQGLIIVLGGAIALLAGGIVVANIALKAFAAAQVIMKGVTVAWTAVQWLLNAALTANPIGLVVIAIVALIAIFVVAWKRSDKFREIVTAAFDKVKSVVSAVVDWFTGPFIDGLKIAFDWIKKGIEIYLTPWRLAFDGIKKVIETLRDVFDIAMEAIYAAVQWAWEKIQPILDRMSSAINAVKDAFDAIGNVVGGAIGWVTGSSRSLSSSSLARGGSTVNVNVSAGVGDPIAIARTIERTLRSAQVRTGIA